MYPVACGVPIGRSQEPSAMTIAQAEDSGAPDERRFEVEVDGEAVPGLLWTPQGAGEPKATILMGHGRTADKATPYVVELARRLARRGWNVVAVDAPGHGERRPPDAEDWPRPAQDQAVREWHCALDFVRQAAGVATDRLGYWGLSMGTALGISLLAGDPRFAAAVLGLMHPNWPSPPGDRIRADAARLACPVLFLVNWDDGLAPRSEAFELFDLVASPDKRLHAYPGDHAQLPEEAATDAERFLARYLDP